jgi:hypothetical protein
MRSDGMSVEINYIGMDAHLSDLSAWLAYDASIGMRQIFNVKDVIGASGDILSATTLYNNDPNIATGCSGGTSNRAVLACVAGVADLSPGFWGWYIYDEPGCPDQSIGYCQGSQAGKNYANVATLAAYLTSIDPTHPVLGVQTPSGPPGACSPGGWSSSCAQAQITNLYGWLSNATTPVTGFDYYPIALSPATESPSDIKQIATLITNVFAASYPAEQLVFTGQAFSWFQEGMGGCTSIALCPYPTTAQMQSMRDNALYYSAAGGHPLQLVLWYYWPDVICLNTYPGCNATANRASVSAAAFAPYPASAP